MPQSGTLVFVWRENSRWTSTLNASATCPKTWLALSDPSHCGPSDRTIAIPPRRKSRVNPFGINPRRGNAAFMSVVGHGQIETHPSCKSDHALAVVNFRCMFGQLAVAPQPDVIQSGGVRYERTACSPDNPVGYASARLQSDRSPKNDPKPWTSNAYKTQPECSHRLPGEESV